MTRKTSVEARAILDKVTPLITSAQLSPQSIDLIQGVARYETGYGDKWTAVDCAGAAASNNWGGVKWPGSPKASDVSQLKCPAPSTNYASWGLGDSIGAFACQDRDAAGVTWWYCFKVYPTPDDGAADMVRVLWNNKSTKAFLLSGDPSTAGFARAMKQGGYFEQDAATYAKNLEANVSPVRSDLGRLANNGGGSRTGPMIGFGVSLLAGLVGGVWAASR